MNHLGNRMQNKVSAAEGIRGIACFMVVLSHLSLSFFPYLHLFDHSRLAPYPLELSIHHSPFAFFYSGTAAVYIFFVLSGYVLSYAIMSGKDPVQKIKSMTIKRYPRLMLPALGSCILLWLAFTYMQPNGAHLSEWIDVMGDQIHTPFWDAWFDGSIRVFWLGYSQYNWVLWTMKIELVGSLLVFALLYAKLKQLNLYLISPLALLFSYIAIHLVPFDATAFQGLKLLDIVEQNLEMISFLIGMLIFFKFRLLSNKVSCALLLLGLYCAGVHDNSASYQWINQWLGGRTYNLLNFLSGPLIVASILMNKSLASIFSSKLPVYLGKISFAAYLNHLMIIYVVGIPFFNLLHNLQVPYAFAALLSCAVVITLTVLFSELYYRLVDQSAMKFSGVIADRLLKKNLQLKK